MTLEAKSFNTIKYICCKAWCRLRMYDTLVRQNCKYMIFCDNMWKNENIIIRTVWLPREAVHFSKRLRAFRKRLLWTLFTLLTIKHLCYFVSNFNQFITKELYCTLIICHQCYHFLSCGHFLILIKSIYVNKWYIQSLMTYCDS